MAKLTVRVSVLIDGESVPMLTIENGETDYALPKDEIVRLNKQMLRNISKAETNYKRS